MDVPQNEEIDENAQFFRHLQVCLSPGSPSQVGKPAFTVDRDRRGPFQALNLVYTYGGFISMGQRATVISEPK